MRVLRESIAEFENAIGRASNRKLRRQLWEELLLTLARNLVPLRPSRTELRAVKRRPNHSPCSTNHDANSWKSLTATATGKADLAIIEALTKDHSRPTPSLASVKTTTSTR